MIDGKARNRALRSACCGLLRALNVTPPLEVRGLVQPIGNIRGRPIELVEHPLTEGLAVSFSLNDIDVVALREHTSIWHSDHSLAHELGHLLCGHLDDNDEGYGGYDTAETADITRIVAMFGEGRRPRGGVRRRLCYDTPQEQAVEFIATTFLEWSIVPGQAPLHLAQDLGLSGALYRTLSFQRGWV